MKTIVINLFGTSGVGKSTTAASLFAILKRRGLNVELVREYVKKWAWKDISVTDYDQIYITGKQIREESILYGKVNYIVTDSPILLGAFYEQYYTGREIVFPAIREFMKLANENDVQYLNMWLNRSSPYDQRGRYQTKEESDKTGEAMKVWIFQNLPDVKELTAPDNQRAEEIMFKYLNL